MHTAFLPFSQLIEKITLHLKEQLDTGKDKHRHRVHGPPFGTRSMGRVHISGPWTRSKMGVHGPWPGAMLWPHPLDTDTKTSVLMKVFCCNFGWRS